MKKNFDKQLDKLEGIVERIQDKSVGLEESMKLFDEGVLLTQECLAFLKETKGHIEDLSAKLKDIDLGEGESNE